MGSSEIIEAIRESAEYSIRVSEPDDEVRDRAFRAWFYLIGWVGVHDKPPFTLSPIPPHVQDGGGIF